MKQKSGLLGSGSAEWTRVETLKVTQGSVKEQ